MYIKKVQTGAEKTKENKIEWGGWTLLAPALPLRPRRIWRVLFAFHFYLHNNLDILAHKYGAYWLF